MFPDVWSVQLDSLQEKEKNLAPFAQLEPTKMNQDKDHANLAQLELGLRMKDPNLKLTVSLFVDMEHMDPLDWSHVWNVPRTATLDHLHLMDSRNALLVLMVCSPSSQEQMMFHSAEKSVNLAITLKLALLPVLLAQLISSNLSVDKENALNVTQQKKPKEQALPLRMNVKTLSVLKEFANMVAFAWQSITGPNASVLLDSLVPDVKLMLMNVLQLLVTMVEPVLIILRVIRKYLHYVPQLILSNLLFEKST